jgi:hypothetical protein
MGGFRLIIAWTGDDGTLCVCDAARRTFLIGLRNNSEK